MPGGNRTSPGLYQIRRRARLEGHTPTSEIAIRDEVASLFPKGATFIAEKHPDGILLRWLNQPVEWRA